MNVCAQRDLATLLPVSPGSKSRTEESLDHAVDGFYLPSLTVFLFVEMGCHPPTPTTGGKLVSRSPTSRRDVGTHVMLFPGIDV